MSLGVVAEFAAICRRAAFDQVRFLVFRPHYHLIHTSLCPPLAHLLGQRVHPFIFSSFSGHMFNSSFRRVARTCSSGSTVPSRPTQPSIATFSSHAHQRRHSSSKPPSPPNNGSSAIPAASVKQVGAPRSDTKRPGAESRLSKKRSSKDKLDAKQESQDDWTSKLPSVPSLQHLNPKGSLHFILPNSSANPDNQIST